MPDGSRRQPITIVTWHSVSDENDPYATPPAVFRRQIAFLKATFGIMRLSAIEQALAEPDAGQRRVVITFDDAFRDFRETAWPILRELGVPAAMFVPTGRVGGFNDWDAPHDRVPRRPIMTAAELRDLHQTGDVEFGSHTVNHRSMASLTDAEMRRQATDSKAALEDMLSAPVTTFAYPYGMLNDFSDASKNALAEAGYRVAVTSHWGTSQRRARLLSLYRIFFRNHDTPAVLGAKVRGLYDWITWKERLGYVVRSARA